MNIVYDQYFTYKNGKKTHDFLYCDEEDGESISNVLRKRLRKSSGIHVTLVFSDIIPSEFEDLLSELKGDDNCIYISIAEQIIKFKKYSIGSSARTIFNKLIFEIQDLGWNASIDKELIELINLTLAKKRVYRNQFAKRWDADVCDRINQCFVHPTEKCIHILLVIQERFFKEMCCTEDYVFPDVVDTVVHCVTRKDRLNRAERAFRACYEHLDTDSRAIMKNIYLQVDNSLLKDGGDTIAVEMDAGLRRSKKMA